MSQSEGEKKKKDKSQKRLDHPEEEERRGKSSGKVFSHHQKRFWFFQIMKCGGGIYGHCCSLLLDLQVCPEAALADGL